MSANTLGVSLRSLLLSSILVLTVTHLGACQGAGLGLSNNNSANANDNSSDPDGGVDTDADLCGVGDDEKVVAAAPKIYNGTVAPEQCLSPGQQLAVGALLFEDYSWGNGCTGTLINNDTVITAAHCVVNWNGSPISANTVRFAVGRDAQNPDHVFNVTSVHPHPSYDGGGDASNDMGLLKLAQPITTAGLTLLPIPVNRTDLPTSLIGQTVQNGGYGDTESSQDNSLMWWTVEEVTDINPGWFTVYGGGSPNGSSVCYGDSGGPSFHLWNGHSLSLLGTVSWGDPSCMDYDHFARADDNFTWIEQNGGTLDPCVGIDTTGICDGNVALWCDNDGKLSQQCCAATGSTCSPDATGNNRCNDSCGGITFEGECQGNDAVWCDAGTLRRRRCDPCGQVCAYIDATIGYYCTDP